MKNCSRGMSHNRRHVIALEIALSHADLQNALSGDND